MEVQQLEVKVTIEGQDKIALINTGAGRCSMNEEHYQTLGSPPLEPAEADFKLHELPQGL